MKPLFSIILAGYQTEPYLQKALDSIANQTFRDFEAICYVEESTDNSLALCQAMADRDPRFIAATGKKSGGGGATRNYGIDHASGEYLVMVDGDDWFMPDMLEKLADKLKQTGSLDVLAFTAVSAESEDFELKQAKRITNFSATDANDVFTGLDAVRRAGKIDQNKNAFNNYSWLNIYRLAFLQKHRLYQRFGVMEDYEWIPRVWYHAERMAYLDVPLYVYRRRPQSLSNSNRIRNLYDMADQTRSLFAFAAATPIPDDVFSIWSNQWISLLYLFLFYPTPSAAYSRTEIKKALSILFAEDGLSDFMRVLSHASRMKQLTKPLILLAAKGLLFPALFFFHKIYYPLSNRRWQKICRQSSAPEKKES